MWLTTWAVATNPMKLFLAAQSEFVRIKSCPFVLAAIKLHHHRVITGCQGWLSDRRSVGYIPTGCHRWGHGQKGVVITKLLTDTGRTLVVHVVPGMHIGLPLMRQSTGTLVTCPPDMLMIARVNLYGPQV